MTIGVGQTILADDYNTLRTKIAAVLGPVSTGYGYTGSNPSLPVSVNDTIRAADWLRVYDELNRVIVHQTNSTIVIPPGVTLPQAGNIVYADFIALLDNYATQATANKAVLAPGQTLSTSDNGSSNRTGAWGSNITHEVTYTWANSAVAQYFFNLGGRIVLSASYANSTGSADDLAWISLINTANSVFDDAGKFYTVTNFNSGITLDYYAASSGNNKIRVRYTKVSATQVKVRVDFETSGTNVNLDIGCTSTIFYSRGDLGGVGAQLPTTQVTIDLQSGGAVPPPVFIPTRVLNIPTTLTAYTWQEGIQSPTQTITLENNGNSTLNISNITFTTNGPVTPVPVYSWGATPVTSINSGSSKTFTLAYAGSSVGAFNNSFTVISNNDTGPVSKATSQTVTAAPAPAFDFSLSPASWTITAGDRTVRNQFFAINAINGSFSSYTASLSGSPAFTINNTDPAGPRVTFTPTILSNGVYSTTLTVTVNSVTKTASIAITLAAPTNQNIGTWLSPQAELNSVIGMSYDFIGGDRYLTIGVGMNADGSEDLAGTGSANINVANLGINADTKYDQGIALYPALGGAGYSSFLTNYGVWLKPFEGGISPPLNVEVERSYKINVPATGNYDWEFSVDDSGYFDIDGAICGDLRNIGNAWASVQTGTINLTSGEHLLTFRVLNNDGPGSIAIRLRNSSTLQEVWSTLDPVRSVSPYTYWGEVYRIPLTKGTYTYYSYDYKVKDFCLADGPGYGDYFGTAGTANTRSMFTVQDDGTGNLSISINTFSVPSGNNDVNKTMTNLSYSFFYYEALAGVIRYTQLGGPAGDGSQTEQFLGFNNNGTVVTSLVTYPGYGAGTGGGFGGGFGWNPIIGTPRLRWDPFLEEWIWEYDPFRNPNDIIS